MLNYGNKDKKKPVAITRPIQHKSNIDVTLKIATTKIKHYSEMLY